MLSFMQHIEVHVIESETDLDLALQAGILSIEQLGHTECQECSTNVAYSAESEFSAFAVVINDADQDWALCMDCAGPVVNSGGSFLDSDSYEFLLRSELQDVDDLDDLENF